MYASFLIRFKFHIFLSDAYIFFPRGCYIQITYTKIILNELNFNWDLEWVSKFDFVLSEIRISSLLLSRWDQCKLNIVFFFPVKDYIYRETRLKVSCISLNNSLQDYLLLNSMNILQYDITIDIYEIH